MAVVNFRNDGRIDAKDRKALREFCSELGGDPVRLAHTLGLKVYEEDLYPDESGYIEYDEFCGSESGYKVVVNVNHSTERKKFTLAHEIGHYVLHRNTKHFQKKRNEGAEIFTFPAGHRSTDRWNYGDYPNWMETEANKFAATVLLPAHLLKTTSEFEAGEPAALANKLVLSVGLVVRRFEEVHFAE